MWLLLCSMTALAADPAPSPWGAPAASATAAPLPGPAAAGQPWGPGPTAASVPHRAIIELEAIRAAPEAFRPHLESPDAETRARATQALGRLRSAAANELLELRIRDADAHVREAAAVALGHTPESERTLLAAVPKERSPAVRAALLVALGRQGQAAGLRILVDALDTPAPLLGTSPEAHAAAHGIGRMAVRHVDGVSRAEVLAGLLRQLGRPDVAVRRQAAFALARIAPRRLAPTAWERLHHHASAEGDPATRALLLRAVGGVQGHRPQITALLADAVRHPDVGVRVAALRAGAVAGWTGVADHLHADAPAVRLQAISAVAAVSRLDHKALLMPIVEAGSSTRSAEALHHSHDTAVLEAAAALQGLAAAGVRLPPAQVRTLIATAAPTPVRAAACLHLPSPARLAELAVEDGEMRVRTAAASALVDRIDGPTPPTFLHLLPLLEAYDEQVVAIGAHGLAQLLATDTSARAPAAAVPTGLESALLAALAESDKPDPTAELLGALEALYAQRRSAPKRAPTPLKERLPKLGAHPSQIVRDAAAPLAARFGTPVPAAPSPLDHVDLDAIDGVLSARIRTDLGDVVVGFFPEEAPIAVANFVALASEGFFDGVRFHRVVPDFVAQAGDPRGDGLGGTSWTIPDEVGALPYDEGVLGMALSGPDTGGSQWFITLSPQPHLDGDYAVFGRVIQGMPVVQRAHEGLRIRRIEVERRPSGD